MDGRSQIFFSGRDQNNETFCLDQKTKDKESEWNKILYLVENENGSKKKKEVLEEDISISVDPEREMDKVKPKRRMPEISNYEVCVFFNWNDAANMRIPWHLRGL